MRIMNISAHIDGYNVSVNNCLDYNIAGASSFFNKEFLKLYCSLWGIYANNIDYKNNITEKVLEAIGLKENKIIALNEKNIINKIVNELNLNHPVIFYTNNSALFYSSVYKEHPITYLNHSFIINGYDEKRKILYIKENSINTKVIDSISKIRPFSEYQLTYEMLIDIYKKTSESIDEMYYSNNALISLELVEEKNIIDIFRKILNELLFLLVSHKDSLIFELSNSIKKNIFLSKFSSEQFRRTHYHSLIPVFDFLEHNFNMKKNDEFINIKTNIMTVRENVINILAKNSFLKKSMNKEQMNSYKSEMLNYNNIFCKFLRQLKITNNNLLDIKKNILQNNDIKIYSDSEDAFLKLDNIRSDAYINDNFSFWKSNNLIGDHWIIIDFEKQQKINYIKITHLVNKVYLTLAYSIYKYNGNNDWELLTEKKDNYDDCNLFYFDSLSTKKIKILITKSNGGIDYAARIKKIEIY